MRCHNLIGSDLSGTKVQCTIDQWLIQIRDEKLRTGAVREDEKPVFETDGIRYLKVDIGNFRETRIDIIERIAGNARHHYDQVLTIICQANPTGSNHSAVISDHICGTDRV